MADDLEVVEPDLAVPVSKVKAPKEKSETTTDEIMDAADGDEDMTADTQLDKKAFWDGFAEKCASVGVNPLELYKYAKEKKKKKRKGKHFTDQDRPEKVKDIYRALKRDHPEMSAEMKARIAARQGKPGKQHQGPPYKAPLSTEKEQD